MWVQQWALEYFFHKWSTNAFCNEKWASLSLIFINRARKFWNRTFSSSAILILGCGASLPSSIGASSSRSSIQDPNVRAYIQAQQIQIISKRNVESQDQQALSQTSPFGQYFTDLSGSGTDFPDY